MKIILVLIMALFISSVAFAQISYPPKPKVVHVNGYYKKDGTYVQPHTRTAPDGIKLNNKSY